MNTRARITALPALITAGAFSSTPVLVNRVAAQGASPTPLADPWVELGLPELTLTVTADAVEGVPDSIEAGRYRLVIHGAATLQDLFAGVTLFQLPTGVTLDVAMEQAQATPDRPPEFYHQSYLPGAGAVGYLGNAEATSVSIIDLVPGEWVAAGLYLTRPPVPFTVTGELLTELPEPESTATISLKEMTIVVDEGSLVAGNNLIKVVNTGDQTHFVEFGKFPDGTTKEQFEATLQFDMTGTPAPGMVDFSEIRFYGNSGDLSPGVTSWFALPLEAGTYGVTCFAPDTAGEGLPHAFMGMYAIVDVE